MGHDGVEGALRRLCRRGDPVVAVGRFAFYRDAAFWLGCTAYAVNRWGLRPHVASAFLRSHYNDLWLIPCALPLVLWVHDRMGWRPAGPPTAREVKGHVTGWSLLFEWVGPRVQASATADAWDVACYAAGGLVAWAWWNRGKLRRSGA